MSVDTEFSQGYLMIRSDNPTERERLDLQHQVWILLLEGRFHTLRDDTHRLASILDIGCGSGAWPLAMAKQHPDSQVIAVDLTPPLADPSAPNCAFIQLDVEVDSWTNIGMFDLIHGRQLNSGIRDWNALLHRCFDHLNPGGWLELLDICHPWRSDQAGVSSADSPFLLVGEDMNRVWAMNGRDYTATARHVPRLQDLGLQEVSEEEVLWPIGPWSKDAAKRKIGEMTMSLVQTFLATAGPMLLAQDPDLSHDEATALIQAGATDLQANWESRKYWLQVKIHRARKPSA